MIKYHVGNLTCTNCAAKIEKAVNDLPEVKGARINLMGESIHIDSEKDASELISTIQKIADEIEPGTIISLEEIKETKEEGRPLWFDLSVSLVLFILGLSNVFGLGQIFYVVAYLLAGHRVVIKAINNILKLDFFDENFLMTIATIGALIIGETMEAAAVMVFYMIGETLQHQAVHQSKKNILSLLDQSVSLVTLKDKTQIDPRLVKVGQTMLISAGEKIQLDGIIVSGESYLDTKALTGESIKRKVSVGDQVFASMINHEGLLEVTVSEPYEHSVMSKMIETLQNAPIKKAKTEKIITRFSRIYTPIVVLLALIIAFVFPLIFKDVNSTTWIHRSLIFLVASCPCALVVSVPLSYFAGLGKASKEQILVKAASHFEEALRIKNIYFDKTGTITKGNFKVTHYTNQQTLYLAALLEQYSKHPIAQSILTENTQPLLDTVTRFREISGQGLAGKINGQTIYVGNSKLMINENIQFQENTQMGSLVYVALDKQFIGSIVIEDELKQHSAQVLNELAQSYNLSILSGDNPQFVKEIASQVNISNYHSNLYPEDKLEIVKKDSQLKMVIGDGINDALILQEADLGVAMGQLGSDVAIETADIVLAKDDLQQLSTFFEIAKKTHRIVLQNISLAIIIKALVLILGTLGYTNMIVAVFADVGVTLLAVLNALRIIY